MLGATSRDDPSRKLRRRMNILEKARSSINPLASSLIPPATEGKSQTAQRSAGGGQTSEDQGHSSLEDYESEPETGDEEDEEQEEGNDKLGKGKDGNVKLEQELSDDEDDVPRPTRRFPQRMGTNQSYGGSDEEPYSPSARAWYEFDLSVVIALLSPIGNYITGGGDLVKNIFLLLLLIFYLHQIIETPWKLYNSYRPRRTLSTSDSSDSSTTLRHASELRFLELFFLILTVVSPFLGAVLLHTLAVILTGDREIISWFSTGLFVLATGIRPWKHLVERFETRAEELHQRVCYPPSADSITLLQTKLEETLERVAQLEKIMAGSKGKLAKTTEEIYDYVDDVVDGFESANKRFDRRVEKQETRLKNVEGDVDLLKKESKARGKRVVMVDTHNLAPIKPSSPRHSSVFSLFLAFLSSLIPSFIWYLLPFNFETHTTTNPTSANGNAANGSGSRINMRTFHPPPSASASLSPIRSSSILASIPEDDPPMPSTTNGTTSPTASRLPPPYASASGSGSTLSSSTTFIAAPSAKQFYLRIPGVNLALRIGDLATLPIRAVLSFLLWQR